MKVKDLFTTLKDVDPELDVFISDEFSSEPLETIEITEDGFVILSTINGDNPNDNDYDAEFWDETEAF